MYPGHDLGPIAADASAGNTGVYINGRNQTAQEVQILSASRARRSNPVATGSTPRAMPATKAIPSASATSSPPRSPRNKAVVQWQVGSATICWNSRFSAGNYNSDNSAGYVSLPVGGTVSYEC